MRINISIDLDPSEFLNPTAGVQVDTVDTGEGAEAAPAASGKPAERQRRSKNLTRRLDVRITERLYMEVEAECVRRGCAPSDILREALETRFAAPNKSEGARSKAS